MFQLRQNKIKEVPAKSQFNKNSKQGFQALKELKHQEFLALKVLVAECLAILVI